VTGESDPHLLTIPLSEGVLSCCHLCGICQIQEPARWLRYFLGHTGASYGSISSVLMMR
jgi:hypothetical protein